MANKGKIRKAKLKSLNKVHWKLPVSFKVPYDKGGNVPFFPTNEYKITDDGSFKANVYTYDWKDNTPFEATLKYDHCVKTRESTTFVFKNKDDASFTMFLRDFLNLIKSYTLKKGEVTTKWTFVRIGRYYGLVAADLKRDKAQYKNKREEPVKRKGYSAERRKYLSDLMKEKWRQRKAQPES